MLLLDQLLHPEKYSTLTHLVQVTELSRRKIVRALILMVPPDHKGRLKMVSSRKQFWEDK